MAFQMNPILTVLLTEMLYVVSIVMSMRMHWWIWGAAWRAPPRQTSLFSSNFWKNWPYNTFAHPLLFAPPSLLNPESATDHYRLHASTISYRKRST